MSPSEEQLRRALSEGAGAGPDVDTVLVRAEAFRRERRTKMLSAVAVVALVAGIGTGVGVLASHSSRSHSTASEKAANQGAGDAAGGSAGGGAYGLSSTGAAASPAPQANGGAAASCPASLPPLPTNSAGEGGFFFSPAATVSSVTVCGYLGTGKAVLDQSSLQPLAHVFTDAAATAITRSITTASTSRSTVSCGAIPAFGLSHLLVTARYTSGVEAPPIQIGVGCNSTVTNGRTFAYEWQRPHELDAFIGDLVTAASKQSQRTVVPSFAPNPSSS